MKRLLTAIVLATALVAAGSSALAASVAPIPVSGPQGCRAMAVRFGADPDTWREIRFTHPTNQSLATGTHTASFSGNTITIQITQEGTVDFTSLLAVEAVYVNKGNGPGAAADIYRYVPAVRSDTDLGLLPVVLSGVDHVVLCWATPAAGTTTVATTTSTPSSTAPSSTAVVLPTSIAPSTAAASSPITQAGSTTVGVLPSTGASGWPPVLAGALLLIGVALALVGRRMADDGARG